MHLLTDILKWLVIVVVAVLNLFVWFDFAKSAWRHHRKSDRKPRA